MQLDQTTSLLIFNLQPENIKKENVFRFENFWVEHENYRGFLNEEWAKDKAHNLDTMVSKLKSLSFNMDQWSKKNFRRADWQIKKCKAELGELKQVPLAEKIKEKIQSCERSLKHRDWNTKFFHASLL